MEHAATLPSTFADSSDDLLHLLYASVHESERRQDFLAALSRYLEMDVAGVHLYHLSQGSVLRYGHRSDAPLFEAASLPADFPATEGLRYPVAGGELLFHMPADTQLGIVWLQESILLHLLGRPWAPVALEELGPKHGQLLAYLLPHFSCLHTLFLKQQAQLPRLNAIRKIHSILPLPLVICRLSDGLLVPNPCAMAMLAKAEAKLEADGKQISAGPQNWQLCREERALRMSRAGGHGVLPTIPFHALTLSTGLHYEVYLLSGMPNEHMAEDLFQEAFGLNEGEAKICVSALSGKNPAEMAMALNLSINTVKARLKSIYKRFQINSVPQLAVRLYFHPVYWAAHSRASTGSRKVW